MYTIYIYTFVDVGNCTVSNESEMLHVMPFMDPDLEINSILFYSKYISIWGI